MVTAGARCFRSRVEADGTHTSLTRRSNGAIRAGGTAGGLTQLVEQVATTAGTPSTYPLLIVRRKVASPAY